MLDSFSRALFCIMAVETKLKDASGKLLQIPVGRIILEGNLFLPENPIGLVIFSHGSGSSRFSSRNNYVAQQLHKKGVATFLVDLLTPQEDTIYVNRFDIDLLTERLVGLTTWITQLKEVKVLPVGYFGASTGAASALRAAAALPRSIKAIVSRGGRPDLAQGVLSKVKAPVLLIVGEFDFDVLRLNQEAYEALACEKKLLVVVEATHLFEEPGALQEVSNLAIDWFEKYFILKT